MIRDVGGRLSSHLEITAEIRFHKGHILRAAILRAAPEPMKQQFEILFSKAKEVAKSQSTAADDSEDTKKDHDENFITSGLDALKNIQTTITKVAKGEQTKPSQRKRTWTHFFKRNTISYLPRRLRKGLKKADPLREQKSKKRKADYKDLTKAMYEAQIALESGNDEEAIRILRGAPRIQKDYLELTPEQVAKREKKVDDDAKRQVSKAFRYKNSKGEHPPNKISHAVSEMLHDVRSNII